MADKACTPMSYVVTRGDGTRYVVYNAAKLNSAADHGQDKWHFGPFPLPLGFTPAEAFDTSLDAEWGARGIDVDRD